MRRLMLGLGLACVIVGSGGCCCWQGSGWTPCPWPGCGWDPCCGWNGGGCSGWGGWTGWPCNSPGGCGDVYWGDWCTGNPHCSTCDSCGNWVGPPSPGGGGVPPEVYGHRGPYGQQVARNMSRPSPSQSQMAQYAPPRQYGPQMARHTNQRVYGGRMMPPMGPQMSPQMARQMGPQRSPQMMRQMGPQMAPEMARQMSPQMGPQMGPQMAQRGQNPAEYEGAIQYLGTTDRLVKPATLPGSSRSSASPSNIARRGEPTLADPQPSDDQESAPPQQVRRASRQYSR